MTQTTNMAIRLRNINNPNGRSIVHCTFQPIKRNDMECNNIIGNGNNYINVYNTGNLGLPIVCNIPFENKGKVLQQYGNQPNFLIEFTNFKYIMNWVVR